MLSSCNSNPLPYYWTLLFQEYLTVQSLVTGLPSQTKEMSFISSAISTSTQGVNKHHMHRDEEMEEVHKKFAHYENHLQLPTSMVPQTLAVRQVVLFSSLLPNSCYYWIWQSSMWLKNAAAFLAQKPLQEPLSHEPKGPQKGKREECRFSFLFIVSMCLYCIVLMHTNDKTRNHF